jgi:hypothetical protein
MTQLLCGEGFKGEFLGSEQEIKTKIIVLWAIAGFNDSKLFC